MEESEEQLLRDENENEVASGEEESPEEESPEEEKEESPKQEAIVEAILDVKRGQHRKLFYRVKWHGYDESECTWEPAKTLEESLEVKQMIEEFKAANPEKLEQVTIKIQRKQKHRGWAYEEEEDEKLQGDRELTKSDPFFGKAAGELTGEMKKLFDPTHKTSEKEIWFANNLPHERITRRMYSQLQKDGNTPSPTQSVSPVPPPAKKQRIGRTLKNSSAAPKNRRVTPTVAKEVDDTATSCSAATADDLFTTEDDGLDVATTSSQASDKLLSNEEPISNILKRAASPSPSPNDSESTATEEIQPRTERIMGKQNYLVYDALPGLPAFPTREIENWDEWEEPDPPSLKETVTIEVLKRYIDKPNQAKITEIHRLTSPEERLKLYSFSERQSGINWLHRILMKNTSCDPSHNADGIIRQICHEMYNGLLKATMNATGNTPLHMAVEQNRVCTTRVMLNYHPDLLIKNTKKQTVLDIAYESNNPTMVKYLLEAGADFTELEKLERKKDPSKRKEKAYQAIFTYVQKLSKVIEEARGRFLFQSRLETVSDDFPIFQQASYSRNIFSFRVRFAPYRIPGPEYTYLLFIYAVSIVGDTYMARCWSKFPQAQAPQLNSKDMEHAQDSENPMIFFCPLVKGFNQIDIYGDAKKWGELCPLIAAQVVLVRKIPENDSYEMNEHAELEKAPLVGPI